jgi:alkanesulfonate monooxygenase SsuD/methylene tetrahydromethanopterin reductase-like flavin-dependent oxidoreductase (luciferase family)
MGKIKISAELSHRCPLNEIIDHSRVLEKGGFYRIWVPDTIVSPWEAWLAASLVIQNTRGVKIGLGVTNPYTRHPLVMAQMACTLQFLSQGRLALSLGKGMARFLEKAGVQTHDRAVEECVQVFRHLTAGERFSFEGEYFHLQALKLRTEPSEGKIPVYLGATGPGSWETGVRIGDGLSTFWDPRLKEIRERYLQEKNLPVAVLVPFSLSHPDFFPNQVSSVDVLAERVKSLEEDGFDEVILAYGDFEDLKMIVKQILIIEDKE